MNTTDYLTALAQQPSTAPRTAPRVGLHALLARMGDPQKRLRCVHIVGSKGKGSTALMLEAMLRAGGRHVGVFTSPHIECWNERIRIDGQPIDDSRFDAILCRLRPHVDELHAQGVAGPVFFEVLLVAALCLFDQIGVDEAIIEAGIGARFDATMVVQADVTALVSVELEHTRLLGSSLAVIADDKAAVARPGVPLVVGALPPPAHRVVADRARSIGAPLIQPRAGFAADNPEVVLVNNAFELPLPAPGRAMAICAAIAFECLRALAVVDRPETVARTGMESVVLPGRLEILGRQPLIVADSAHTPASMAALLEAMLAWGVTRSPLGLVLSCSHGRDLPALIAPLLPYTRYIHVTRADANRSIDPRQLVDALRPHCAANVDVRVIETVNIALSEARERAPKHGIVCATGSVYMAGAARGWFASDKAD